MLKQILSTFVAVSTLIGAAQLTYAEDELIDSPLNINVPAAGTTYSSIAVMWDKPEEYKNITGYRVYVNGKVKKDTAANETVYTAEGLEPDTEYTFSVSSLEGSRESKRTDEIQVKTDTKGNVHNVMDAPYNAKGDGKTLDTAAIQAAVDDCEDNDIVLIPEKYTFLTGAIDLKSNMTLEVNGTLLSSKNAADFEKKADSTKEYTGGTATGVTYTAEAPRRLIWSRIEGWEQYSYRSLINVGYLDENTDYGTDTNYVCSNVKIIGKGTITGDNSSTYYAPIKGNATALAINEGNSAGTFYDIANSETSENNIKSRIRGRLINISNAENVYIKGITAAKPPMWAVHMIYSNNVTTNGVTFNTSGYRNGDGWDPDSSANCTIFNSVFNTGDDCVAIKSGKNPEGNEIGRASENIKVIGCKSSGGLGLAVGSEMSGGVDGVYVRDCVLSNTRYGIELKANKVRGGYIKNFHVQDSTVDRILIHSVTYNADGSPASTSPVFSDMSFSNMNILAYNSLESNPWINTAVEMEGFTNSSKNDDNYIKNIEFSDIVVGTEKNVSQKISMKYCRNITFNNVLQSDGTAPNYSNTDAEFTVNDGNPEDGIPTFKSSIEAEKMKLDGYETESNDAASGGSCINVNKAGKGTAEARFSGENGTYRLKVIHFDENDGNEKFNLYVNNELIESWTADKDLGSAAADAVSLTSHEVKLKLSKGDIIKLEGIKDGYAPARVDRLEMYKEEDISNKDISMAADDSETSFVYADGNVTGNLKAVITLYNPSQEQRADVYMAVYKENGTLVSAAKQSADLKEGDNPIEFGDIKFSAGEDDVFNVKVLAWSNEQKALTKPAKKNISKTAGNIVWNFNNYVTEKTAMNLFEDNTFNCNDAVIVGSGELDYIDTNTGVHFNGKSVTGENANRYIAYTPLNDGVMHITAKRSYTKGELYYSVSPELTGGQPIENLSNNADWAEGTVNMTAGTTYYLYCVGSGMEIKRMEFKR